MLLKPKNVVPIHVDGGFEHFTDRFVYLGSIISSDLADDAECGARIAAAAGAFRCLRAHIFSEPLVDLRAKSAAYQALILNLLLYGSECWALSSHMLERLRSFHRRCVRTMCGCSLKMEVVTYSRSGRITSHAELEKRMCMPDITTLLSRRWLQWAGHVLRMGKERLPHRMLASWIQTARPKGRPHLTFAQGLVKDLAYAALNTSNWGVLAAYRRAWRMTPNNLGTNGAKLCPHVNTCFWRFRYSALPLVQAQNSAAPPICKLCR